jgi:ribosomal protein S8
MPKLEKTCYSGTASLSVSLVCGSIPKTDEMPRVINGLGIAIVSTSKGVMTG